MKVGMNLLLWTAFVTEEHFPILEKIKKTGYDGVEIPLFDGDAEHYKKMDTHFYVHAKIFEKIKGKKKQF